MLTIPFDSPAEKAGQATQGDTFHEMSYWSRSMMELLLITHIDTLTIKEKILKQGKK